MSGRRAVPGPAEAARRRFLKAVGALVLLGSSGFGDSFLALGAMGQGKTLRRSLAEMFRSPRKARVLGERYLAMRPEAADRSELLSRLGFCDTPVSAASLRAQLASLRERDFAQNRIVAIDGWVLAQSEADLCALLSLG